MIAEVETTAFDVCGPLPTGVTVLEASAGTGKTFTIAALAARYVADGIPLHELLLVTFTRMATGELRERVRERLVSAEQALGHALAGALPADSDEVARLLADGPHDVVAARRERLSLALADFDAATIDTTHGFCGEVLDGLGVAGDVDPAHTFVDDLFPLVEEVVDDLYVRRFHKHGSPPLDRGQALRIARMAVENPAAPIDPPPSDERSVPALRRRFAQAVRQEVEARKRALGVLTYDDLLIRLDATLAGPAGPAAARRLRARYRVVLVDEFQDTDPVQWDIMRRAFADGGGTLVLIGDPKQAIYAFRGADVYAYLAAAATAGARRTLQVNWRSDQGLIDAYDALFGGATLGHEGIAYREVKAARANVAPRLHGAPVAAPLRVRVVPRDGGAVELTRTGLAATPATREYIARDLAADAVALLASGAEMERRAHDGSTLGRERVRPGHLAVLVRANRTAALVRDALEEAGVPAVINGAGSVFATLPARHWLRLLEALERPAMSARARAVALTPFLGWSAERVARAGDDEWEGVHRRLHHWARVLRLAGVAALAETITLSEGLPGRVLATAGGERRMTDLRHVAQLLHAAATTEQMGTTALTAWLRTRIARADEDTDDEDRSRRLESDAEAVQVLTIHRSKGLEFPVVYCPDLWDTRTPDETAPVAFHDGAARRIDVGLQGADYVRHRERALAESRGEDLRLAYVALTRARHQAVAWWAGAWASPHSALGRLLFARDPDGGVRPKGGRTPPDAAVVERLRALAAGAPPGRIAVERAEPAAARPWHADAPEPAGLQAAAFERELDRRWRRTSYSDIAAGTREARVGSEPEEPLLDDEPAGEAGAPAPPGGGDHDALRAVPVPLAAMPAGVHVGTLVHRVLEAADFAAPDLDAELAARIGEAQARRHVELGSRAVVVAGLRAALETPLGPRLGGVRLCDVPRADRLDELDFELPLAGGDAPAEPVALAEVAALLRARLPPGDPLASYADQLEDPALRPALRGYLAGSIDLVLRLGDRYAVIDYKTNWLSGPGEAPTAWHHRPAALAAEMRRAHYGLQALLYTVALHRFLRWRLPGYDPGRNLAGAYYLFLRGMTGAATPVVDGAPCGVFAWQPPAGLVAALSDVLDGRAAA